VSAFISKYGVAVHVYIPMIKRGVVDFAVSADWTPAAGDCKVSKDGGAAANVTNLPTAITMGNTAMWDFSMTATEMQAAKVMVTIADSATKAVEDSMFIVWTHGNASAQYQVDLADSVRAGLTALPNAAAEAAGGLYTRGSGAGQINQATSGQIDGNLVRIANVAVSTSTAQLGVNAVNVGGTAQTGRDLGASVLLSSGTGTGQISLSSGAVLLQATQTGVTIPTVTTVGSVTGAVGSVTGAVGSVTGAVGSVTGNVGGNVVGSVGSVTGAVGSVTAAVATTSNVKKNQALASFQFLMTDSTNHAPATGKTVSVTRAIDSGAFGAGSLSAVTEIANGLYRVDFAAADLNGNVITLRATASGCDDTFERIVTQP
jgi:hypothetical protein